MGMSTGSTREINVTPLIDVLLVLLIIFLVMMPILARVETVELPPNEPNAQPEAPALVIKLQSDLTIMIDDGAPQLSSELATIRPLLVTGKHVFVDAEPAVPWEEVVGLVDRVRGLAPTPDAIQIAVRIREPAE